MFQATRLAATYAGGCYVADKLITVGMAIQVGMAADHLQHCARGIMDMVPECASRDPNRLFCTRRWERSVLVSRWRLLHMPVW